MRRLWLAAALLAAIFGAALGNSLYLSRLTRALTGLLEAAEEQADAGNWDCANSLTQEALQLWRDRELYLYVTLRHADTNEVYTGFREVEGFLEEREEEEYPAANGRLIAQLELLREMEHLDLKNVL